MQKRTYEASAESIAKTTGLESHCRWDLAFSELKPAILRVIEKLGAKSILEIGGGRTPFLTLEEQEKLEINYTINDIDPAELAAAPPGHDTLCFDISTQKRVQGEFDFVFSRSVLEHTEDNRRSFRNCYDLLRPGGVMFHFFPTLYHPAFLANKLMPFALSEFLMERLTSASYKRFPAHYDLCTSGNTVATALAEAGFSDSSFVRFYGQPYFDNLGPLRAADRWLSTQAMKRQVSSYTTFNYLIGVRDADQGHSIQIDLNGSTSRLGQSAAA